MNGSANHIPDKYPAVRAKVRASWASATREHGHGRECKREGAGHEREHDHEKGHECEQGTMGTPEGGQP